MDTLHLAPTPAVEAEIRSALHHYARTIDQKRYYDWLNLFTDDGSYAVITYENLQDQGLYLYKDDGRAALEERVVYLVGYWKVARGKTLHTVSNIEVTPVSADEAKCTSYFVVYYTGDEGVTELYSCGECHDTLVKRDGRWLFREHKVVVDNGILPPNFTELL
jgi:3-phenylpropionate/cinnamic acid dioxygenase small subunit